MEQNLKVLAVGGTSEAFTNLTDIFERQSIRLHRVESGAEALILTGNMFYDLLVIEDPLPDLPVDNVLSSLQALDWSSGGAPALVLTESPKVETMLRRLTTFPCRVVSKLAEHTDLQQAISELLGVAVRSTARMIVNVQVELEDGGPLRCYQSENLSESGVLLRGGQTLAVGTRIRLVFNLPDEPEPIAGKAVVVRHTSGDEQTGIGTRFVELGTVELVRLRKFVERTATRTHVPSNQGEGVPVPATTG